MFHISIIVLVYQLSELDSLFLSQKLLIRYFSIFFENIKERCGLVGEVTSLIYGFGQAMGGDQGLT